MLPGLYKDVNDTGLIFFEIRYNLLPLLVFGINPGYKGGQRLFSVKAPKSQ